jgi:glycosyltransferase involved in cell wall biosynthesis
MIINLLDPGLLQIEGHHLEWDRRIAAELIAQGHELTVYSHVGITPEVCAKFPDPIKLVPLFRNYSYFDPLKLDPVAGELLGFLDVAAMLAQDLRATAKADLWLWPSLFQAQLYACALIKPDAPIAGCIHVEPGFRSSQVGAYWKYAFIKARQAGLRMNLGVSGPILQEEYCELVGNRQFVKSLPLPVPGCPGGAPRPGLKTVGFFGHQRQEKGAELVPLLVSMLLREGYQVVLHDSGNAFGGERIPGLTRLGYVPDLAAEIAKCDLVVVPYEAESYRCRESSIVWEAMASGVPVVVPYGTAPALRVLTSGAGRVFHFPTVDSIYSAITEAKANYEQIASGAYQASQQWHQTHGTEKLVQALTRLPSASR